MDLSENHFTVQEELLKNAYNEYCKTYRAILELDPTCESVNLQSKYWNVTQVNVIVYKITTNFYVEALFKIKGPQIMHLRIPWKKIVDSQNPSCPNISTLSKPFVGHVFNDCSKYVLLATAQAFISGSNGQRF